MLASLIYSLVRVFLDVVATSHGERAELEAEVLALRRQVQILERQIQWVRWTGDRMNRRSAARLMFGSLMRKGETSP